MCGICGWFNFDPAWPVDEHVVSKMTSTLTHRGPDDNGIYCKGNFAMGHTRLSIIDVKTGHQPMSNRDKSIWVAFNGEIYNYVEIRNDLRRKGHKFSTTSDTEVIVHLYEDKQELFLEDLRGMFAIALWDEKNRKLILARDRVGKKPLYYYKNDDYLIFGSEIKAILESDQIDRDINLEALDQYLSFLYVPAPISIFKGIMKLEAGHFLVCQNGNITITKYWDLDYRHDITERKEDEYYLEKFDDLLNEAVKLRLRSDVPLGAFLSGGIDSSAIVLTMAKHLDRPVETISIGFGEDEYNELHYAKQVAELCGSSHSEFIVNPDISNIVPELIKYFDEPFADSSFIPTYYVSKVAREKVTVVLSGDGGDELMAGYPRHLIDSYEHKIRFFSDRLPPSLLFRIYEYLPKSMKGRNIIRNLSLPADVAASRKHYNHLFNSELKKLLYVDNNSALLYDFSERFRKFYNSANTENSLDKALYLDIKTYLVDDILVKVDRMSMANSLEVRSPLLDHKILEFLTTVPSNLKLRKTTSKYLLKRLFQDKLPENIIKRRKQGFRLPIEVWLKNDLKEQTSDIIFSQSFADRGYFNVKYVRKMWDDFIDGKNNYAHQIWQLFILELWHREYIDL